MSFIKKIKIKKDKLFFWLGFIFLSILLPFQARAQLGIGVFTAPFVKLAEIGTILIIAISLSWGILALAQIVLNWASSPALVGGITTNDFVMEGWRLVRDFSNLFFILIVVAIGIATALRIRRYEVRKTLPRLIAAAILINFSPVICGVLIDLANILMNYFLTAGAGRFGDALSLAKSSGDYLLGSLRQSLFSWSDLWRGIFFVKAIFAIVFNFFAAFVLFLLAILFLMRTLMLWILVIFSPFAFLTAVLPGTKKYVFNWWSRNFLQWTFIGVSAAFFIYLSQLMLHLGVINLLGSTPATGASEFGGPTITNIIVLAVPFVFLIIGYSITLAFSPWGAKAIMNLGRRTLAQTKGKAGKYAKTRLRDLRQDVAERTKAAMPEKFKERMRKWATTQEPTGWRKAVIGPAYMAWAKRKMGRAFGPKPEAATKELINKVEKEAEGLSVDMTVSRFREEKNMARKIAYLNKLAKNNELDDAFEAGLDPSELVPVMEKAQEAGVHKDMFAAMPHLAREAIERKGIREGTSPAQRKKEFEEMIGKIRPNRTKFITGDALTDDKTVDAMIDQWDKSRFAPLVQELGRTASDPIINRIKDRARAAGYKGPQAGRDWLQANNPSLLRYIDSDAGAGFFGDI